MTRFAILQSNAVQQLWRIRYYTMALLAQRGVPVLLLPWFVMQFGKDGYADYALFYAAVQIGATITGGGLPLAIIPFWAHQKDKSAFIAQCLQACIVVTLPAAVLAIAATSLAPLKATIFVGMSAVQTLGWLALFLVAYNANIVGLAVARCENRALPYFAASLVSAAILCTGLLLAINFDFRELDFFFGIQLAALVCMTLALFGRRLRRLPGDLLRRHRGLAGLMRASRPLAVNSLLLLLAMSIDKWTAKLWFDRDVFSTYVIDYQAAFTLMFVPTAIGTYLGPRLSAACAGKNWIDFRRESRTGRWLVLFGSAAIAIFMYGYAYVTGLGLSPGYWILVIAFLLEGQYAISNQQVSAFRDFRSLLGSTVFAIFVFSGVLVFSGVIRNVQMLYAAPLFYELSILLLVSRSARRNLVACDHESMTGKQR